MNCLNGLNAAVNGLMTAKDDNVKGAWGIIYNDAIAQVAEFIRSVDAPAPVTAEAQPQEPEGDAPADIMDAPVEVEDTPED